MRYLEEVEAGVDVLRVELSKKLREDKSSLDQRKRIITNLVQLNSEQDPAWECIQISYDRLLKMLDQNRDEHLALDRKKAMTTNLAKPMFMNKSESIFPGKVSNLLRAKFGKKFGKCCLSILKHCDLTNFLISLGIKFKFANP